MPRPSSFTQFEIMDFYSSDTNQFMEVGQLAMAANGQMFRYVKAGGSNLVKGNLLQSPARDTNFTDMAVQAAVAAGATVIPVTLGGSATTANQFNGGTLSVTVTPGIGQTFTIVSHDVASSGTCNFTVLEPVITALTTSSKVTATLNQFNGVIQSPTTITGSVVGVAVKDIAASSFGWIQTHGICAVLSDATVGTIGQGVQRSTSTAGAVTQATTNGFPIGQAVVLGVSAECQPVFLTID